MRFTKPKYSVPLILSIIGISISVGILSIYSRRIIQENAAFDSVVALPGNVVSDAINLIYIMLPVYVIEFLLLTIPVAALMLIVNRAVRARWYTQSIVHMGGRFDVYRMLRRSVAPALFSLSFSEVILGYVPEWFFTQPELGFSRTVAYLYLNPVFSLNGALITLAVALAVYMPTWLLNDAGIVSHLKSEELENRICPDTQSVGKWYSDFISGFALLAYPLTVFIQYFYRWIVAPPTEVSLPGILIYSSLWSLILPLLVMAFVLPVVILNELFLDKFTPPLRGLARQLGAGEIYVKDLGDVMLDASENLAEHAQSDA
ncbi:hypothetical protein EU546_04415 [Candidatus Thorarchaeota archaeon]|nr:MAG: hypothetical protein EU546_04415 [Candidatus Thorarchaeota archaeon]